MNDRILGLISFIAISDDKTIVPVAGLALDLQIPYQPYHAIFEFVCNCSDFYA